MVKKKNKLKSWVITKDYLSSRVSYNQDTGVFTRLTEMKSRFKKGDVVGCVTKAHHSGMKYLVVRFNYKLFLLHRLAWLYHYGELPDGQIDHINGDTRDNRIKNLRVVSSGENQKNLKIRTDNTSGYTGVHVYGDKWLAKINVSGKGIHLGIFSNISDAISARKKANKKYNFHDNHGSFRSRL